MPADRIVSITIRAAEPADEATTIALWRSCGLIVAHNDPAADFRFARAGASSDVLVGQDEGGRIIGSVMVGHDGHRGWLYYVASDPGSRGSGVGRRMVQAAETWLGDRGVAKVQLMVRPTNTQATAFYERLGFEETPRTILAKWLGTKP